MAFLSTAFLIFLSLTGNAPAATVSLSWDASPDPTVTGYRVEYGNTSGNWSNTVEAATTTAATINDLIDGTTFYFVVVAYNADSVMSAPSNEVSYLTAGVAPTPTPTPTATPSATPSSTPSFTPSPTATPNGTTPTPTPRQRKARRRTKAVVGSLNHFFTTGTVGSDGKLVGAIVVTGSSAQPLTIRALGPSLTATGITGALSDTTITIYDGSGVVIASNDDWQTATSPVAATLAPSDPREAALATLLAPGTYAFAITGKNNESGVAALDVYSNSTKNVKVTEVTTAANVDNTAKILSGTFTIDGPAPHRVLIRAMGPSLVVTAPDHALSDPVLSLYDATGSLIYENNSWKEVQAQQIINSGYAPADDRECAIIATLAPGTYTARIRSADATDGTALVDVHDLGQ